MKLTVGRSIAAVTLLLFSCDLHAAEVSCYPINAFYFRMIQPDGSERMFQRCGFGGEDLVGEDGWTGKVLKRRIRVEAPTAPKRAEGERLEFERGLLIGSGDQKPSNRKGIAAQFPSEAQQKSMVEEFAKSSDIWRKSGRLRFLSANPNITALLLSEIFLLLLGTTVFCKCKVLRLGLVILSLLALSMLFMTSSRSGLLAAGMSALVLLGLQFRKCLSWKKVGLASLGVVVLVGVLFWFHVGDRYTRGLVTDSEGDTLRRDIIRVMPVMVADSPSGVGLGNAGATFSAWYDEAEVPHQIRTLISSHFTWFVEFGTVGRFLYLFGWLILLTGLAVAAWRGCTPLPFCVWLCVALAAFFNPVLENAWVWCLPTATLLPFVARTRMRHWRIISVLCGLSAVIAAITLVSVIRRGNATPRQLSLEVDSHAVRVNGDSPETWIVGDEFVVGGWNFIGREMLEHYIEFPDAAAIGYVEDLAHLPPRVKRLVLTGRHAEKYLEAWKDPMFRRGLCQAESVLMISPSISVWDIPSELVDSVHLRASVGSIAARQCPDYDQGVPEWTRIVPGALLYIPRWVASALDF